jgi:hypothetical protein
MAKGDEEEVWRVFEGKAAAWKFLLSMPRDEAHKANRKEKVYRVLHGGREVFVIQRGPKNAAGDVYKLFGMKISLEPPPPEFDTKHQVKLAWEALPAAKKTMLTYKEFEAERLKDK